ncbi:TPA: LysE family translocator [Legionella pneumophila]|jgi:RhtB (resistance to homoserine/threonine) family protein|uniref:LysE family transporter n=1 Tax=Legionella pneumophila TaxID=446 RepID=A0AAN5R6G1_LEGPN|nr:LysE family transporter [Legionella pneumophila]HAT1972058.1 LysE family transporter [Legionella pneumophila]HAT6958175.1 LysE family transporter [Legionella pneumophila]HEN4771816.1 LysE family transporter [Legionella pneumophila]
MEQWHQFTLLLPLIILVFISLISPGPDFAIIVKNSLAYSRRSGLFTALGIALGSLVHISYTLLGLGLFITKTPIILRIIQYLGAGYLFYIGLKNLKAQPNTDKMGDYSTYNDLKPSKAFFNGFITNLLNPKAMLFFISLFSVLMPEEISIQTKLFLAMVLFLQILLWFSFVAFSLSGKNTRAKFQRISYWIERITGVILIALALKLLLSQLA